MKHSSRVTYFTLLLFFGLVANAETYTVKKGDSLASIARAHYGEPVFGPKGTIKKIYKMNPWAKANVPLEPGQKVELESKKVAEPVAEAVPPAAAPAVPEAPPAPPPEVTPAEKAAHEMDLKPHGPVADEHEPPPPPAREPIHEMHERAGEERPRNYFSLIANYSFITQTATESASGDSFTMHSSPAWGAELGWDHWWNDSFSTVFTYAAMEMSSKESSGATGEKVLKNVNLNQTELALLNRVVHWMRFGVGAVYGDHLFIEGPGGTPSNPQIYKMSFLNPFITAEITPLEGVKFEWLINLKISELPAQVGFGHDVTTGTEYFAETALMQKFTAFSLLYGVSSATENQSRTDGKETRQETALRVGVLF
jgi:hypothetical protein